ncbi:rod-binding protein [Wenxinia saemankumensis]|uniref:Rod binding protein n=1 Tax=Wenxinia saemankumensis TaxID=1447782 RepID=A0A1M6G595_9RHOB|nr:rod-binding protein [Wenxinia saemankumensis]SHJ05178.1 Rod binding protein [Wenxinia saemankumensis]
MTEPIDTARSAQGSAVRPAPPPDPLRAAAEELEATFLAEMLGAAGLGPRGGAFGGGPAEDQVSSLLRMEQSRAIVRAGGLGLAESIHAALLARAGSGGDRR